MIAAGDKEREGKSPVGVGQTLGRCIRGYKRREEGTIRVAAPGLWARLEREGRGRGHRIRQELIRDNFHVMVFDFITTLQLQCLYQNTEF